MSLNVNPFFSAELELRMPEMVFQPSLNKNSAGGFYDLVEGLLCDIYQIASLVGRVSGTDSQSFKNCVYRIPYPRKY